MKHLYSPAGDQRENSVKCFYCNTHTWNVCGCCDKHCTHDTFNALRAIEDLHQYRVSTRISR